MKQYHGYYSATEPPTNTNSNGKNVLATIKYHGIHIQSYGFDASLSVLTEKGLNVKIMKQYHGYYSATEPPTNTNYNTRLILW
jgi:hypothetical protein